MNGSPDVMASTARAYSAAGISGGGISMSLTRLMSSRRSLNALKSNNGWLA
jgi:hypothetical protein